MTIPVQITFRHMESSAAVETRVRELTDHLGNFSDRIQGCRVVVDSPHSGMEWPDDFRPAAPPEAILTTWDAFVDDLWAGARGAIQFIRATLRAAACRDSCPIEPHCSCRPAGSARCCRRRSSRAAIMLRGWNSPAR